MIILQHWKEKQVLLKKIATVSSSENIQINMISDQLILSGKIS